MGLGGVGWTLHYGHDPVMNRVFSAFLLVGAAAALGLSFVLTPSPAGWGTHLQLHLAPCLFHLFTGLPCPFCGMTTAFAHMARGQVAAAFSDHCLGPALFVLTWVVGLAGARGLVTGTWPLPHAVMRARFQSGVLAVVTLGWVVSVARVLLSGQ
jgi:hypothetical protein